VPSTTGVTVTAEPAQDWARPCTYCGQTVLVASDLDRLYWLDPEPDPAGKLGVHVFNGKLWARQLRGRSPTKNELAYIDHADSCPNRHARSPKKSGNSEGSISGEKGPQPQAGLW